MNRLLIFTFLFLTISEANNQLPSGFSVHELDNGLQVLLIENPALPMVGVNVVVKTGSAYETFSTNGMSHMLEHLLFNGTTSRSQKQLYDETDMIGGYNNANTGKYYTNYMMVTPSEFIQKGMELQADMLFNSVLPEDKLEKEKGIVLEEIARSLGNSGEQVERNLQSILYRGHALSLPTLGTYSTIETLDRSVIWDYYKGTYQPNNMILTAVGSFNSEEMLDKISSIYGQAAPGSVFRPSNSELQIDYAGQKSSTLYRSYSGDDYIEQLVYQLPDYFTNDHFTLIQELLDEKIIGIETKIKEKYQNLVKSIDFAIHPSKVASYLVVNIYSDSLSIDKNISSEIQKKMSSLRFNTSKNQIRTLVTREKTKFLKNLEKPHMFGIYNANILAEKGIDDVLNLLNPSIPDAAIDLQKYRIAEPTQIVKQEPLANTVNDSSQPVITKIINTSAYQPTLIARQNHSSQLLAIHFLFKHKAYYESVYGKDAAKILHDCFGQRMKKDENQAQSGQFGFTFTVNDNPYIPMDDIYLHPDFGYIRVEGLADDLENAIRFITDQIISFIPTETEFKNAKNKFSSAGFSMRSDPARNLFDETYRSAIYNPDFYKNDSLELTYTNLVQFSEQYFHSANQIISSVTPKNPDTIANYFTSPGLAQKEDNAPETPYQKGLKSLSSPVQIEKDEEGEQTYIFWGFIKEIEEADEAALKALSLVLSEKIVFDVREKQGLAYRMSTGIELNQNKALFYFRLGTRPQNEELLVPQLPGFFNPDMLNDITEEDVTKSINMYLGRMMFRRLSSINQAYYLAHSYYFHDDIYYDQNFYERLGGVTLEDVVLVGEKYLHIENPISIIVR